MSTPRRIQIIRRKGFRLPEGAVSVARGSIFGNPFRIEEHGRVTAKMKFEQWIAGEIPGPYPPDTLLAHLESLRGKDLACHCESDRPCHADVLLRLANAPLPEVSPTRPLLRYHGGKWMLANWIIEQFPAHRVYVEPFGGAASVLLQKPRSYAEIYNDLDGEVVHLFRMVRERGEELAQAVEMTPFSRLEFQEAYTPTEDPIELARRTIIRSFMGFGSDGVHSSHRTGFRSDSNRSGTTPAADWRNYPPALRLIIDRLRGVVIEQRPAIDIIRKHDGPQTLHYIDPPYVHETRKVVSAHRGYRHEMTDDDHRELAATLNQVAGAVILSGYECPLYSELFADWRRIERPSFADGARPRSEVLWLRNVHTSDLLFA